MKILKPGREQTGWAKEFTCTGGGNGGGGCGAVLLVEDADVFHTGSGHYDGSTSEYNTFCCAQCGVLTDLPDTVYLPSRPRQFLSPEAARKRWLLARRAPLQRS